MGKETTFKEMVENHGLKYVWRCPRCHYEYEDIPGTNERGSCARCGVTCEFDGEVYNG